MSLLALFPQVAEKFIKLRNTRHPLGQRFIKPLEHAEKVERHIAPLSRKKVTNARNETASAVSFLFAQNCRSAEGRQGPVSRHRASSSPRSAIP